MPYSPEDLPIMSALINDRSTERRQVIVSGATGFVGRHLVPLLLDDGYEVVAMGRDEVKARRFAWFDRVRFIAADIEASPTFVPKVDAALVHLAWAGLPNYKSAFHFEQNLPHSHAFIKYFLANGVTQVLVTGTCFEYGLQSGPLSVATDCKPSNAYGFAKHALRQQLSFLQADLSFTLQWARLFYMHGEGQHPRSILALLDAAIDRGDGRFDMSGGEQLRDYLHVGEVARQLLDLLRGGQEGTVNVCSGAPISIRRLVETRIAARRSDIALNLGHYPYPDYEPMAFWGVRNIR